MSPSSCHQNREESSGSIIQEPRGNAAPTFMEEERGDEVDVDEAAIPAPTIPLLGYLDEDPSLIPVNRCEVQSKVGGKPDWLALDILPSVDDLACRHCGNLMMFLLQLYAPRTPAGATEPGEDSVAGNSYHRMIYIFICWTCGKDAKALRCQLPLENKWLPSEASKVAEFEQSAEGQECARLMQLYCCDTCGLPKETSDRAVNIQCSGRTQRSVHLRCTNAGTFKGFVQGSFPETRLLIEEEEAEAVPRIDADVEARALRALAEGPKIVEVLDEGESNKNVIEDDDDEAVDSDPFAKLEDPILDKYITFMSAHPPHIIRYGAANPLWFSLDKRIVDSDSQVPLCGYCGAKRTFEFQIQSSAIDAVGCNNNYELGFGVICVYTCSRDCSGSDKSEPFHPEEQQTSTTGGNYLTEFIHIQKDTTMDKRIFKQL